LSYFVASQNLLMNGYAKKGTGVAEENYCAQVSDATYRIALRPQAGEVDASTFVSVPDSVACNLRTRRYRGTPTSTQGART